MSSANMDAKFDIALIQEVKKYTMLYNVNAKGYTNCEKKSRIWNNIGQRLQTTGRNCYKRWQSMKNSYKQNVLRAQKNGRQPTWIYYDKMKFLEKYPRPKQMKIFELEHKKQKIECSNDGKSGNFNEDYMCLRLIEEVKKHDILYDRTALNYYDSAMRAEVWREIAHNLGSSEHACKDKWRSFRDLFIRIRKRLLMYKNFEDTQYHGRQWKFFTHMEFLDKYIVFNVEPAVVSGDDSSTYNNQKTTAKSSSISESQNSDFDEKKKLYDNTKKTFNKEENLKLIELVKQHEVLFHRKYAAKPTIVRNGEWEYIATALNTNVPSCKERWRCLRDQYIKFKRRIENEDLAPGEQDVRWPYYNALKFLNPHIQKRNRENTHTGDENMVEHTLVDYSQDKQTMEYEIREEYPKNFEEFKSCDTPFEDYLNTLSNTIDEKEFLDLNELEHNGLSNDGERLSNVISDNEEDEQILYLQTDGNENYDEISSDSCLSSKADDKPNKKHNLLENLAELLQKLKQECVTCAERRLTLKDSTNLLFESLAISVKNAKLSQSDLLELQSDMHSFVTQRLVKYKKNKSEELPVFEFTSLN